MPVLDAVVEAALQDQQQDEARQGQSTFVHTWWTTLVGNEDVELGGSLVKTKEIICLVQAHLLQQVRATYDGNAGELNVQFNKNDDGQGKQKNVLARTLHGTCRLSPTTSTTALFVLVFDFFINSLHSEKSNICI